MRNIPVELLREQIESVLTAWGMDAALVHTTADIMIETDLAGVESHGVSMLWEYDQWRLRGKVNLHARFRIVRENAATALVDADAGLGTNPIAFAAPARRHRPFVLDMATSTVAANKVRIYDMKRKALPPGWVVDEHGAAVRDAGVGMDIVFRRPKDQGGGLAPLGGTADMASHKGYGLAMLAHILGGALSGGSFSPIRVKTQQPGDPDNIGHFFMALDPTTFRPAGAFEDDLDAAIDVLHATPAVDPSQPVLVPGDPEAVTRDERLRTGIPISNPLAAKIREVCDRSGAAFLLT